MVSGGSTRTFARSMSYSERSDGARKRARVGSLELSDGACELGRMGSIELSDGILDPCKLA